MWVNEILTRTLHYRRFFRTHCEYVAEQRRSPRGKRRSTFPTISSPITAFKQRQPVPVHTLDEESSIPQFDFTGPTPGATQTNGQGNDLPSINERPEEPILSDVRTFSSSPRQASILLPSPIDERRRSEPSVFATATGVSSRVVTYHPIVLKGKLRYSTCLILTLLQRVDQLLHEGIRGALPMGLVLR